MGVFFSSADLHGTNPQNNENQLGFPEEVISLVTGIGLWKNTTIY
jgi:hypothetical protein